MKHFRGKPGALFFENILNSCAKFANCPPLNETESLMPVRQKDLH